MVVGWCSSSIYQQGLTNRNPQTANHQRLRERVLIHPSEQEHLMSQETVHREGVTGGSVLLPCSSSEHDHKLQDIDVSWRHNGSENVYDIVKGEYSLEFQDRRYKNRVETFPLEYERGNFSIKLNNLNYTDTGEFNCLISPSNEQKNVVLIIKGA
ncbi:butyrophilin-like protein [Pimephales promelas]|nr:butyrophilin-like protein [Pimephales promelas]